MSSLIYYFTSTGNSLETARILGQKLGARLISIAALDKESSLVCTADCIGIVYPVYYCGPPLIVRRFAEKLKVSNPQAYIFTTATYGGLAITGGDRLKKILQKNGVVLNAFYALKMPGNYTVLYGAPAAKTIARILHKAQASLDRLAKQILSRKQNQPERFLNFLGNIFYQRASAGFAQSSRKFWVKDVCSSCGICGRVCPAHNIYLQNGRPNWLERCEHCLACLHWCPTGAIEWGKATRGRRRYHHPAVSVLDIEKSRRYSA
ncbi:MAG: EFR1 family ferrodoxin [Candidatus Margulisbacteria bacterium]|jgi:formate hydrogenlyase subunit 6/NADH:ubiquinone oxidoreductase subunit I|nr:EFR1 family ferrodoxin [Candidatus Margulisiibacteriota bacterium]